jgi:glycolate oxidase
VLGLHVVLADGSLLRTGRRTIKGVAGYDLARLFVGSEGTLGVIVQATLRLRPNPPPATTLVAFFPALQSATHAVAAITAAGVVPSLLELLDRTTVCAVDDWKRMGLDREAAALLLAQSDAPASDHEIERMAACCQEAGATFVTFTSDPNEGEQLLAARRLAYPALERQGATLLDDVAVPRSRIPDFITAVERIAEQTGLLIGTFGHVGDGNMHPTIVFARDDEAQAQAAQRAFDAIVCTALELDGTVTGEHGVGILKRAHLARELGSVALGVHRAIKAALDPLGVLNPGKVLPWSEPRGQLA